MHLTQKCIVLECMPKAFPIPWIIWENMMPVGTSTLNLNIFVEMMILTRFSKLGNGAQTKKHKSVHKRVFIVFVFLMQCLPPKMDIGGFKYMLIYFTLPVEMTLLFVTAI